VVEPLVDRRLGADDHEAQSGQTVETAASTGSIMVVLGRLDAVGGAHIS
jgi:hypothetical protein